MPVFLLRPFATIPAHSSAENEQYRNSRSVIAAPSINAFAVLLQEVLVISNSLKQTDRKEGTRNSSVRLSG
jgi:hypothetical protein